MLTREQVLAATRAVQLFGEAALESRRALRKAYAELTKAFPPEKDPECFRRIRDAYEALGAHFELLENITPKPVAVPPREVEEPRGFRPAPVPDRRSGPEAVLEACADLINQGNARGALAHLDAHEAEVRTVAPAPFFRMLVFLLGQLAWEIDRARAERAFEDLDDPALEIGEHDYWLLYARLITGQAWQEARHDDELPAELLDAIRRSDDLPRLELATLWHDTVKQLGSNRFLKAYDTIADRHPALLVELYRIEDEITFVGRFNAAWEFEELKLALPERFTGEVEALQQLRRAAWAKQEPPPKPVERPADPWTWPVVVVLALWMLLHAFVGKRPADCVATSLALPITYLASRKPKRPKDDARPVAKLLREGCLKLVVAGGLFRHEVLAAVAGKRVPESTQVGEDVFLPELVDPLLDVERHPPTGLALLSPAQLERIRRQEETAAAAARPGAA